MSLKPPRPARTTIRCVRDDDGNTFEVEGTGREVLIRFYTPKHDEVPEPCSRLQFGQARWLAKELLAMATPRPKDEEGMA